MEFTSTHKPNGLNVSLSGKLTFEDNTKFRQILTLLDKGDVKTLDMDFSDLDFIDSAGLGMLLLLRQECMNRNTSLSLQATRGQVKRIFAISKFDQLFANVS
jgi:HptB-dependent secretion and biofilm anti anti-sigma factor